LLGFFAKKPNKIAASKKLFKATALKEQILFNGLRLLDLKRW